MFVNMSVHGRRRTVNDGGRILVQEQPASPAYTPVSPDVIAPRLTAAGYSVCPAARRPGRWSQAIIVSAPGGGEYRECVSVLLDNSGQCALKIKRAAVRGSCTNEFHGGVCWRARHDSAAAGEFLADPASVVRRILADEPSPAGILDVIRGRGDGMELLAPILREFPRIGAETQTIAEERYAERGRITYWSVAQALADPQGRYSAGRGRLADRLIAVGSRAL